MLTMHGLVFIPSTTLERYVPRKMGNLTAILKITQPSGFHGLLASLWFNYFIHTLIFSPLITPISKLFCLTYEDEDVEQVVLEGVPPRPEHLLRVRPVQQVLLDVALDDGSHGFAGLRQTEERFLLSRPLSLQQLASSSPPLTISTPSIPPHGNQLA